MIKTVKIDWLSFSVATSPYNGTDNFRAYQHDIIATIRDSIPSFDYLLNCLPDAWDEGQGRPPYSWSQVQRGIRIFFGFNTPTALVEISGIGCDTLRDFGIMEKMFQETDMSRIDIAFDVKCDTYPSEIVSNHMTGNKMRSRQTIISDTGETVYIGSRKSDRYLRIYRFNEPHPRHEWLRFEFVLRKKYASRVREQLAQGIKPEIIAYSLAEQYQIEFPAFFNSTTTIDVSGIRGTTTANKTEMWLIKQAIPAFWKLVKEGHIEDPNEWINTHFFD